MWTLRMNQRGSYAPTGNIEQVEGTIPLADRRELRMIGGVAREEDATAVTRSTAHEHQSVLPRSPEAASAEVLRRARAP